VSPVGIPGAVVVGTETHELNGHVTDTVTVEEGLAQSVTDADNGKSEGWSVTVDEDNEDIHGGSPP